MNNDQYEALDDPEHIHHQHYLRKQQRYITDADQDNRDQQQPALQHYNNSKRYHQNHPFHSNARVSSV